MAVAAVRRCCLAMDNAALLPVAVRLVSTDLRAHQPCPILPPCSQQPQLSAMASPTDLWTIIADITPPIEQYLYGSRVHAKVARKSVTKEESDDDFTLQFNQMIWWRHFCRVNGVNWIATTEECRIEHEARTKRIKLWTHGTLQQMFGAYDNDSSDSDDGDDGDYEPAKKHSAVLSPNSFEKSLGQTLAAFIN